MEDEIVGMEGLSEEERNALMQEQRQIMAQIEHETQATTDAKADAFDQRSANAVAQVASGDETATTVELGGGQCVSLNGKEKTQAAIANGTAILVQCVPCQSWVQVTDTATLMYCPVCTVVSPVERQSAVHTKEEVMQMIADQRMAEALQNEEYVEDGQEQEEETWWDSVTSVFATKAPPAGPAQPQPVAGVEAETITFSTSFEEQREGLLGGTSMPRARVAERQPLFSCVVDSVSTAASSVMAGALTTTLSQDEQGNVYSVDSTLLLSSESDAPYSILTT